jgi:hypothetical protein
MSVQVGRGSWVSGDEDGGDAKTHREQSCMHLDSVHTRHLDIGNQALSFSQVARVQKI